MRLAIITSWYPSESSPLYGIFVQKQAEELALSNVVDVLLLERGILGNTEISHSKNLTTHKKRCVYLPNRNETLLKLWAHQYYLLFKKLHTNHEYDIIHCHDHYGAYAGWYIHKKLGIPYVVTIHNSSIQRMTLVNWKKVYLPKVLNSSQEVLAVGHKLKTILEDNFTSKSVIVVPNIVDTNSFIPAKKNQEKSSFKFLFIGDLDENKGVMRLLSAFLELADPNTSIHIIGRGPLRKAAEEFINANDIVHRVILQDHQPNEKLPSIYNEADAYISLSNDETFGITILEAMSCGLPVIYTQSGGPEYIVANHGCYLTSKTDIKQIANTMTDVIEEAQNIDPEKIRQHVLDNYSASSIIDQLMQIYKSHIDG